MKIALIGYGKMGRTIEKIALEQGCEIVIKVGSSNLHELNAGNLKKADVAIEFSRPDTAFSNIEMCLNANVPIVSGTTAWTNRLDEAKDLCKAQKGAFFYASNFSIGVNLFFAMNRYLATLMESQSQYNVWMEEIHHKQKLDYPSGTAVTLADEIMERFTAKKLKKAILKSSKNQDAIVEGDSPEKLIIVSKREEGVPGTHVVNWASEIDHIQIRHEAFSRKGFANGALAAAAWIIGREGYFEMKDMLGF